MTFRLDDAARHHQADQDKIGDLQNKIDQLQKQLDNQAGEMDPLRRRNAQLEDELNRMDKENRDLLIELQRTQSVRGHHKLKALAARLPAL